jgi:glycosyltransferase involved in cell wall biosynthesis
VTLSATEFSLLLPVYGKDDAGHLARSFASATGDQTLRPTEVVVVRDGPVPPALATVLAGLADTTDVPVRIVELERNTGLAAALTAGLAACSFDVVARQDADDVSEPNRFALQLAAIDTGLDLVGSGLVEFVDDETQPVGRRIPPLSEPDIRAYARFHDPFNHPTVVYRRQMVQRAGGYLDVGLMEDYWLFVRMLAAGARVLNLPDALVKYRIGTGAYARRGGVSQLKAEIALQRLMRGLGFTSRAQWARNVAVRGAYRLVPVGLRTFAYRRILHRDFANVDRVVAS